MKKQKLFHLKKEPPLKQTLLELIIHKDVQL